jgi:hypothetical protein
VSSLNAHPAEILDTTSAPKTVSLSKGPIISCPLEVSAFLEPNIFICFIKFPYVAITLDDTCTHIFICKATVFKEAATASFD